MQRPLLVLAVVALVVLAGCNTFSGVGTTREPFDVETVEPTTAPVQETPPVISFDPVQDESPAAFELVAAHQNAIAGRSYTVTYRHTQTYANGTTLLNETVTAAFAANRSTYTHHRVSAFRNDSAERELYANDSHVLARTKLPNADSPTVRLLTTADGDPVPPRDAIVTIGPSTMRSGLLAMNVTDVQKLDTVPSTVDEPLFRVVANETSGVDPYGEETLNATLTLLVTEEGRIVEFRQAYSYVRDGETIHARTTVRYERIGSTTVRAPDWSPANNTSGNGSTGEFVPSRDHWHRPPVLLETREQALAPFAPPKSSDPVRERSGAL